MSSLHTSLFRMALRAFPERDFDDEMQLVFEERYRERGPLARISFAIGDSLDVIVCGLRLRMEERSNQPAVAALIAVAMLATTLALHDAARSPTRIDFRGTDPRGAFTITVIDGKAIAATLNGIPVAGDRIVQVSDSISILDAQGEPELAVRFDRNKGHISWSARK
jgi:hypothetical protein